MLEPRRSHQATSPGQEPERVTWGIGTAIGALVLAQAIYIVLGSIFVVVAYDFYQHHKLEFGIVSYQFLAVAVVVTVVWLIVRRQNAGLAALGFRFPGLDRLAISLASLVPIFLGVALIYAAFTTFFPAYHIQGNGQQSIPIGHSHVSALKGFLILLWVSVEVPLVEETLFRGIIYQGLQRFFSRWLSGPVAVLAGAVVSGLLFGLAHLEPHTWPVLIFMGIALAYVFEYGHGIFASALVHGAINFLAAISLFQNP